MKKVLSLILAVLMVFAIAPAAFANISVTLDGVEIEFDVPPQIIDNRTMVPLRAIFEALDAHIDWDGDTQTVTAVRFGLVVIMQVGNPVITVGATEIELDVPPVIVDDRTLVPARAVAESFGVEVDWDEYTQTVILTTYVQYVPAPQEPTPQEPPLGDSDIYYTDGDDWDWDVITDWEDPADWYDPSDMYDPDEWDPAMHEPEEPEVEEPDDWYDPMDAGQWM